MVGNETDQENVIADEQLQQSPGDHIATQRSIALSVSFHGLLWSF